MGNVIQATTRFGIDKNSAVEGNFFVLHRTVEEVQPLLENAISHRTEVFKPGHPESFMVTGVQVQDYFIRNDRYTDRVTVISLPYNASGNVRGFSSAAESIVDCANNVGLRDFIERGLEGLYLMVLGGSFDDDDIVTVGPRLILGEDKETWVENPESYGVFWGDRQSFILGELLGQCTCGMPNTVIEFTYNAIRHLGLPYDEKDTLGPRTSSYKAAVEKYGYGPLYFLWHNLEILDFTEHGSSAPGWLTGEGEHFLALLKMEIDEMSEGN